MLSDRDLHKLAISQDIVSPYNPANCEGATINLTLGTLIKKYNSDNPIILGSKVSKDNYIEIDISKQEFYLNPNESVLIQTYEFIKVPNNLAARIYERYSVKSLGLMISPAHYMNPGYRGYIGLLAVNHSSVPIRLVPGIKICQFALFELSSEPLKPYERQDAKYMDAQSASISMLHLDKEIQEFLHEKGVSNVSNDLAYELGDYLLKQIRESSRRLADILREEEGSDT